MNHPVKSEQPQCYNGPMEPKGSLVRTIFATQFYRHDDMENFDYHFALRNGEVLVYLGEMNSDGYAKCMSRGVVGWVGKGAFEWVR